ncbi:N-formylglutamate amidohydrolase [Campylobacter devanensis]|uniref:N-formylglutamate amidohydrolase n=1 Tax=Campylobacter devanensis TaxID=3161138 RepID=UPI000A32F266|nr:N-formylglutamate amidohydrolase [Campylobacter sp. P090]
MNIFSSVLFHLPHDSSRVPAWCKEQFMLSKVAFKKELILMRDYKTKALLDFAKSAFEKAGFEVALNTPFAGAITPIKFYEKDSRVSSLMIEVRRDLYMDETTGKLRGDYLVTKARLNRACKQICKYFN